MKNTNIESINNKYDLISYYLDNYEDNLKKSFCELILNKIGKENFISPVKLSIQKKSAITNIINDPSKNDNEKFEDCLNNLTFEQIHYIGW
jgi:hypothetical protein